MAMSKIPILKPVVTGYRDTWNVIQAMPVFVLYVFVATLTMNRLLYLHPELTPENGLAGTVVSLAANAVQNFFLTPIIIAVHRYVILGETTTSYVLKPRSRAFQAFFIWLTTLSAMPMLATALFAPSGVQSYALKSTWIVITVTLMVVSLRLSILFPAIAIGAPGATAVNAWYDSKKSTFRIFLIFVLAVLPIALGAIAIVLTTGAALGQAEAPASMLTEFGTSLVQALTLILFVAIASRLYEALADRVLRGPTLKPA